MEKKKREKARVNLLETTSEEEEEEENEKRGTLPYPKVDKIKILGLTFDRNIGFTSNIANTIAKTRMRQNILKRLGGCTWGAETNLLRVTHKAIIEGVVGYGIVAMGSGAYESELRRLDTCTLNPAARAITGVGPYARLITLHSMAGTISIHNLYIQG